MPKTTAKQVGQALQEMQAKTAREAERKASVEATEAAKIKAVRSTALGQAAEQIADRVGQALLDDIALGKHPYPGVRRSVEAPAPSGGRFEGSDTLVGTAGFRLELNQTPAWAALGTKTPPNEQECAQLHNQVVQGLRDRGFEVSGLDVGREGFSGERVYVAVYLRDPEFDKHFGIGTKLGELMHRFFTGDRSERLHTPHLLFPTGTSDSFVYGR